MSQLARDPQRLWFDEETRWVEAAAAGDLGAFRLLHDHYLDQIWWDVHHLMGPDADVDELVQESFVQLFRSIKTYQHETPFHVHVYRLTRDTAWEALGRGSNTVKLGDWRPLQAGSQTWESVGSTLRLRALYAAMQKLGLESREAFVLHDIQGKSLREIAQLTGESINTITSRVARARVRLIAVLQMTQSAAVDAAESADCIQTRDLAFEHYRHELVPDAQLSVQMHLDVCAACRFFSSRLAGLLKSTDQVPDRLPGINREELAGRLFAQLTTPVQSRPAATIREIAFDPVGGDVPMHRRHWVAVLGILFGVVLMGVVVSGRFQHPPTSAAAYLESRFETSLSASDTVEDMDHDAPTLLRKKYPQPAPEQLMAEALMPAAGGLSLGPRTLSTAERREAAGRELTAHNHADAARHYELLLATLLPGDPQSVAVRLELANLYHHHLDHPRKAAEHLRRFVAEWPNNAAAPAAQAELCAILRAQGQQDSACLEP